MIVVDFSGLPGCGKSTLTYKLYNELKEENLIVEMFNKNEYLNTGNRKKNINDYLRLLLPSNIKFYFKIVYPIRKHKVSNGVLNYGIKERIWKELRLVLLYDKLVNIRKNIDVVLIDQGIIQDFSDYIMFRNIPKNIFKNYSELYSKSKNSFLFVSYNASVEESMKRIKLRNRKKYKFDFLKNDDLKKFLIEEEKNLKFVTNEFNSNFSCLLLNSDFNLMKKNISDIKNSIVKIRR